MPDGRGRQAFQCSKSIARFFTNDVRRSHLENEFVARCQNTLTRHLIACTLAGGSRFIFAVRSRVIPTAASTSQTSKDMYKDNNVTITGTGSQVMMFAHGFGCDQNMWRQIVPSFEASHKIVLFDHVGAGRSNITAFNPQRYASLEGYADDVLDICAHLNVQGGIFVGHSVSAMIGVLAAIKQPTYFSRLVLIGPSPCYINQDGYYGGFDASDIEGLLETMEANHLGWSRSMSPVIMGNAERPELAEELGDSFCRTDPDVAKHFARTTFTADNRKDLGRVQTPALILQCSQDVIAPSAVGEYVHANIQGSELVTLEATGHCPHMSAPQEVIRAIKHYLSQHPS